MLLEAALNVGTRFINTLANCGSDIAFKLPSTVLVNDAKTPNAHSPDTKLKGSPILDVVIERILTTPPLNYNYVKDITPNSSILDNPQSFADYGVPSIISRYRTPSVKFHLGTPDTLEWFNLPPIIKLPSSNSPGTYYYQPKEEYIAKEMIMHHIASLHSRFTQHPKTTKSYREDDRSSLTREQHIAIKSIEDFPITVITGGPGVGKTFVAKEIFRKYGYSQTRLIGYTGALVSHLRSVILDSLDTSTTNITEIVHMVHQQYHTQYKSTHAPPKLIRIVIIDELPMFDNRTLAMALSLYTDTQTRVVFLADENQIGAIGLGSVFTQFKQFYDDKQQTIDGPSTPSTLINFCTLTQNFRQSVATQQLRDLLKEFAQGRSHVLLKNGLHANAQAGVSYIPLPLPTDNAHNIKTLADTIDNNFTQTPIHQRLDLYYNTMFLTFTKATQDAVNMIISSIVLIHQTQQLGIKQLPKITYYIGQRVMIKGRNFHGSGTPPTLQLFNGEVYVIDTIALVPQSPRPDAYKNTKEPAPDILTELAQITSNETGSKKPLYRWASADKSTNAFRLDGACNSKTILIKLRKWMANGQDSNTFRYAMVDVGSPGPQDLLKGCPALYVQNLSEAWAMTVNKAQGCEFDRVCLVIKDGTNETKDFTPGHGLVAISRAKHQFTLISDSVEILDKMWGVVARNEEGAIPQISHSGLILSKKEPLSDLKMHLLSPLAPWNITSNKEDIGKGGMKRPNSAMS